MADDIARLGLEVDSSDVKKGTKELDHLEKQGRKTEGTTRRMTSGFSAMGGAIAALGVGVLAHQIISANAEFSKLHGALTTVTGSAEAANDVVERMKTLMAVVPGDLNEITSSFIKLKALGLDPSEAAMISYSNTAAAMGKDLNQMIEAVADAATGEFERLKEFGIKAASEGDRVKFTFQGVTKEVGKNSQEIQDYLLDIGNTQFAGAAAKQMDTFGGALDNVGSQLSALMIADDGLPGATAALKELAAVISDPKTKEGMDGLITGIAKLVEWSAKGVVGFVDFGKAIGDLAGEAVAGPIEKEATQAIAIMGAQEAKVTAMRDTIESYNKNLAALKGSDATKEQIAAFEQSIEVQERLLDREQRRLEVMQGINKETSVSAEVQAAATPDISEEAAPSPGIDPKLREKLDKQLEDLQAYYASDTELALAALIEKQELLTELEEANIGTEEERKELRLEATKEYEDTLLGITQDRLDKERAAKDKAAADDFKRDKLANSLAIAVMRDGGNNASRILRDFAKEQAQMWVYKSVLSAFADTPGPVWVKAGAAAVAGIFAGQLVDKMLGGGGGGGGGAAAAAMADTGGDTTQQAPRGLESESESEVSERRTVSATFDGDEMAEALARPMLLTLNRALEDVGSDTRIAM